MTTPDRQLDDLLAAVAKVERATATVNRAANGLPRHRLADAGAQLRTAQANLFRTANQVRITRRKAVINTPSAPGLEARPSKDQS